jgi:hypothetical protein
MNAGARHLMMRSVVFLAVVVGLPVNQENGGVPGWKLRGELARNRWKIGTASLDPSDPHRIVVAPEGQDMVNTAGRGCDLYTEARWGDARVELELMVAKGQSSGIYLMGEYEVQVLDSFGKERVGEGDMGGLYAVEPPRTNAAKPPGEWQKFVIHFQAPRFDDRGQKTKNAKFVKVELNGVVLHENVDVLGPTPGGLSGRESATGPILLQGSHGVVAFRRVNVIPG